MTDTEILAALDDRQTLALTGLFEAGIDGDVGIVAVMCVVRNRVSRAKRLIADGFMHTHGSVSYKSICLAPEQFSCWNPASGANHDRLMAWAGHFHSLLGFIPADYPRLAECLILADGIIDGSITDTTGGATSYWAPAAMLPPGRIPDWAVGKTTTRIGSQEFVA